MTSYLEYIRCHYCSEYVCIALLNPMSMPVYYKSRAHIRDVYSMRAVIYKRTGLTPFSEALSIAGIFLNNLKR